MDAVREVLGVPASSKEKPAPHSTLFRWLFVLAALYVCGTVFGGMGLGWIALHPPRRPLDAVEERRAQAIAQRDGEKFKDVEVLASDGTQLRGWFIQPPDPNGRAVILLHGVSDNRLGMYGYGRWLLENHYAVLLPDARGHGLSGGLATYGLNEAEDVHRWVDWLEQTYHPKCIFGFGESLGAAELLQALAKESHFCAVVAESPFATFREVAYARFGRAFHTGPWLGRTVFRPTVDVGFWYARLAQGLDFEQASPAKAVADTKVPIMLIHGLEDRNIPPYHADWITSMNRTDILVWKVPAATHTGAHQAAPQEFEHKVLQWFEQHSAGPGH